MNTNLLHVQNGTQPVKQVIQQLYNHYGAMLLGYIVGVVKDEALAEQYLIETFKEVPLQLTELSKTGDNDYCKLQMLARKKLSVFFDSAKNCSLKETINDVVIRGHEPIGHMNVQQQQVFCGIHYHGKSITLLAAELGTTEDTVKKILKEAFTIIRSSGNAGVY